MNTPKPGPARLRLKLFDAESDDGEIGLDEVALDALSDQRLLWVDLEDNCGDDTAAVLEQLVARLQLHDGAEALRGFDGKPSLLNFDHWFLVQVVPVEATGKLQFEGRGLAIVCGRNFVATLHRGPVDFIDELHERERGASRIGSLRAESFTASLLDWHVDSYLQAVSLLEADVDRLEVSVLSRNGDQECLPELAKLRRGASRLRRMLAPHRHVFGSLARPDFRPNPDGLVGKEFRALELRFERAMDAVEMGRELVVGSFELFTTRSAQRTNDTVRVLTFVTVLLGTLAVVAGVLGMNFQAPLFETGAFGFWMTIAAMALIAGLATLVARWRKWL